VRLFGAKGERLATVYRQNHKSDRVWVGYGDRHEPTSGTIELQTWARVEVRLAPAARGAVLTVRVDGQLVYQDAVPFDVQAVHDIQIGNDSKGQPFDLFVDNVKVQG
jgi:ribosomal protein L25 (general stress protein Ctc)